MSFTPPSLPTDSNDNFTYHSKIDTDEPVILGVDEAGRGPVIGPMVYAVAYCPITYKEQLKSHGYNDSKVLKEQVRLEMFTELCTTDLKNKLGWATTALSPMKISQGMLDPLLPYNLNEQAHDTTRDLIKLVLDSGIKIAEVYVDTVGPPEKYQAKLKQLFPQINSITVTKKADSLFPIVSLASICAKVTRDLCVTRTLGTNCGSGYPADPNTVKWLKSNMDPLFGWGNYVRYSWQTAEKMLNEQGYNVNWELQAEAKENKKRRFTEAPATLPQISLDMLGSCI
ncbi:ribonuclease H2 catalytic subunit [Starmerella bacillaris]|uniref:Ribonuclease n=1 Tax=Starmerella bacillaris TaxID=1247836 RepID=A0AAV5REG8_STABA|nr:ribonuclease H2 catalytic subunit [Starmerella bacillaris]